MRKNPIEKKVINDPNSTPIEIISMKYGETSLHNRGSFPMIIGRMLVAS